MLLCAQHFPIPLSCMGPVGSVGEGLLLVLWDPKGTGRCWDAGGQGEVLLGTGFLAATGGHRTLGGWSPPSRVGAEERSLQPTACPTPGDVSGQAGDLGRYRTARRKSSFGQQFSLSDTASPPPSTYLDVSTWSVQAHFKGWGSAGGWLWGPALVGRQHCGLVTQTLEGNMDWCKNTTAATKSEGQESDVPGVWSLRGAEMARETWHQAACLQH